MRSRDIPTLRGPAVGAGLLLLLASSVPASAPAAVITVQSQTGTVSASGGTPDLGSSSDSAPVGGTSDLDLQASVSDSGVSESYAADASLQTFLDPDQILIQGTTVADATSACFFSFELPCHATADVALTIRFALDTPALAHFDADDDGSSFSGPYVFLEHLGLGFVLAVYEGSGGYSIDSCGSLSGSECSELIPVFGLAGPGGLLPAGSYELSYDIFAFDNTNSSCALGCGSAGGSAALIVPEPATASLLALGLLGLAATRVRSRR